MKKRLTVLSLLLIMLFLGFFLLMFGILPVGCKKVNQTYIIGKQKCCYGLDFAPTSNPNENICLPKLSGGMAY